MSGRNSSPSSPAPSKLPRFLQKSARDRSRSAPDPDSPGADAVLPDLDPPGAVPLTRARTRAERPRSTASELTHSHSLYSSASSSRLSDLPTRISGWFNHTFSASTTDLSLSNILANSHSSSKVKLPPNFLSAMPARAVRYIFDTDSAPDKSPDPIWLLGILHPAYDHPPQLPATPPASPAAKLSSRNSGSPQSLRSSDFSLSSSSNSSFHDLPELGSNKPGWPPAFYADFTSRIWLTYRSHFPPIRDGRLADLACGPLPKDMLPDPQADMNSPATAKPRVWPWSSGEKGWTSDSGWGCMLRTGQSLLANALIHLHLSRDWRRPPYPIYTVDYATYVQILTWFFDTPAADAPFSVHRMALAGKELGKDVGQWFGPSTAAGAIKTLVHSFPECGIAVALAIDSALYQSDVYVASHGGTAHARSPRKMIKTTWGDRPVLLLLGVRLGIDRVNPIYYDTIKQLYTFPQSVGIAGGRPSSSYYFVGAQGNNLFYLDPHQSRHAVNLRPAPPTITPSLNRDTELGADSDRELGTKSINSRSRKSARSPSLRQSNHARIPASPSSVRTSSSNVSYHTPISPSPLQYQYSTESSTSTNSTDISSQGGHHQHPYSQRHTQPKSPPPVSHARWHNNQNDARRRSSDADASTHSGSGTGDGGSSLAESLIGGLDAVQQHYATAYSAAELRTFHCEQVRKMPMSGLDPSMLIGFLCRDEGEWADFKRRVGELPRTIFSVQDEPPAWTLDSDDNMGLESISDPEDEVDEGEVDDEEDDDDDDDDEDGVVEIEVEVVDDDEEEEEGERQRQRRRQARKDSDEFFDTRSRSSAESRSRSRSDTEEDPVGPITPGPGARFAAMPGGGGDDEPEDDDDDWVDPSVPSPPPSRRRSPTAPVVVEDGGRKDKGKDKDKDKGRKKKTGPGLVPVVRPQMQTQAGSGKKKTKTKGKGKASSRHVRSGWGDDQDELLEQDTVPEQEQEQEHYLFPSAGTDDEADRYGSEEATPLDRSRVNTATPGVMTKGSGEDAVVVVSSGKRMNTARARDGGRTQSGGVKGVLTE